MTNRVRNIEGYSGISAKQTSPGSSGPGRAPNRRHTLHRIGALSMLASLAAACDATPPLKQKSEDLYYEKLLPTYVAGLPSKKIAIVGAGTAGLATAWNLRRLGHTVTIYDRMLPSMKGGNVNTVPVIVKDPTNPSVTYNRFSDIGVNDFNTKTYRHGTFMYDYLGVQHKALEDSAMWGNTTGLFYQVDGPVDKGSAQLSQNQLNSIQADSSYFFGHGWEVATDIKYAEMTVDEYIAYKRGSNVTKGSVTYNCNAASPTNCYPFTDEFVNYNLKARISNMYFTDQNEPGLMPIRGVLYYYILQEGLNPTGAPQPDRRYYVGGAINIINRLYDAVTAAAPSFPELPAGATIGPPVVYTGCATVDYVDVSTASKSVTYHSDPGTDTYYNWPTGCSTSGATTVGGYDYVILSTNLNGTQKILSNSTGTRVPQAIIDAVSPMTGGGATAVAHQYPGAASDGTQLNVNYLRTYNILIYDNYVNTFINPTPTPVFRPYTITYVENRHQADAQSGISQPTFFTSESPKKMPPDAYVLTRSDNSQLAKNIPTYHQYMTFNTLLAQRKILGDRYTYPTPLQGTNGLYLGGGWVRGAGLQEEVFIHSEQIAAQINDQVTGKNGYVDEHIYDYSPGAARYAPLYIAQIAYTPNTYSGVYRGGKDVVGDSAYCRQRFDFAAQNGHTYRTSVCPGTGGTFTGDTFLTIYRSDGSICCQNDDTGGACGLGSQCDCTANSNDNLTLCAGTYYGASLATWDYSVTDMWSGSSTGSQVCNTFNALKDSQYTLSCPASTGSPLITTQTGPSISCTGGPLCAPGNAPNVTCTAFANNPITVCGTGASATWSINITAKQAANASQTLPTQPDSFTLPRRGGTGGGECVDSNRTCPAGSVATGMIVAEGSWAQRVNLICTQVAYAGNGSVPVLGTTTTQSSTCGTAGPTTTYDCNSDPNNPAVISGQRVWIDTFNNWVARVRPICRHIKDNSVFNPDGGGSGDYNDLCPPDTEVYNYMARTGTVIDQIGLVCSDSVPLYPKLSCQGACGQTTASGCSCAPGCTTNCCPDINLFCQAPTCAGTKVGGYCYYLGAFGQSCTTVCSAHGGFSYDATVNYIGSAGSLANCGTVLNALGQAGTAGDGTWPYGTGCMRFNSSPQTNFRITSPATDADSANAAAARACGCAN